jgi:hypothetical protein
MGVISLEFFGACFLILEIYIVLAAFFRACVPRLQACIVFSWLISKCDPEKTTDSKKKCTPSFQYRSTCLDKTSEHDTNL